MKLILSLLLGLFTGIVVALISDWFKLPGQDIPMLWLYLIIAVTSPVAAWVIWLHLPKDM
jgi:hypothetical protein